MATYVVGDVQGCWDAFQRLLSALSFDPQNDPVKFIWRIKGGLKSDF